MLAELTINIPSPTWRNGRSREVGSSKRLDRFLLYESLLPCLSNYRTWATPTDVSDHYPICLEWGTNFGSHGRPFKFNRAWLMEEDFAQPVSSSWKAPLTAENFSHMDVLILKLRRLKGTLKAWEKEKNLERKQQI